MSINAPLTEANFTLFFGPGRGKTPDALERFAGVPVTVTASGQLVGFGHMAPTVFVPAANHLYATEIDDQVSERELLGHSEAVEHRWAVVTSYTNAEEWEISTEAVSEATAGSFPVTILDR